MPTEPNRNIPTIEVSSSTKKNFKSLKGKIEVLENRMMDDNLFMIHIRYLVEKELKLNKIGK